MQRTILLISTVVIALTLSGCPGPGVSPTRYPVRVDGIGDSPNYPLRAAEFERAEIMSFAPGMTDISTAYNLLSAEVQIAATIYRSSKEGRAPELATQFQAEKIQIEQYHPGAQLLEEKSITLEKNGQTYPALKASYQYRGIFMHRPQTVYSELVYWSHGENYLKLRSTAPIAQREKAEAKNMELLNAVNWAN